VGWFHWADLVLAWCRDRGHTSPDRSDPDAGPLVIAHIGTRLDTELWIARATTPEHTRIAVVQINDDPPSVYDDYIHDPDHWWDADTVDIVCPGGHGWTWQTGREMITIDGSFSTLTVVFGLDLDAPFTPCPACFAAATTATAPACGCDRSSWILCPTCGLRCDVELPAR
jgi:hypothetical protein